MRHTTPWRWPTVALVGLTLAAGPVAAQKTDIESALLEVLQRAIEHGPAAAGLRLRLANETLATDAETAADGPRIGWQREGIDSSFGRASNATNYLRLSTAFNDPWQRGAARELGRRHAAWADVATRAGMLEVVGMAGRSWLDWAVAEAELTIAKARLTRVEGILMLQEKKLELGEVAGAEVEQLRLEFARNAAAARRTHARVRVAEADLVAQVGGPVESPGASALETLLASVGDDGLPSATPTDSAVAVQSARAWAEAEVARSRWRRTSAWGRPEGELEWERVGGFDGTEGFDAFGVQVSVPLRFGRRGRALRAHAEVAESLAKADIDRIGLMAERRRASARAEVDAATDDLSLFADLLARLPMTERSLTEQFRLGAISYIALIDGLSRLDDLRREAIEARHSLLAARLELAVLTGDRTLFPLPALETP